MASYTLELTQAELQNFKTVFFNDLTDNEKQVLENDALWETLQESHNKWESDYTEWLRLWKDMSNVLKEHRELFWKFITHFALFSQTRLNIVNRNNYGRRFTNVMGQLANGLL